MAPAEEPGLHPEDTGEPLGSSREVTWSDLHGGGSQAAVEKGVRPLGWGMPWSQKPPPPMPRTPLTAPISPQGCFIFSLVKYIPLTYNKVYVYPTWAIGLGWSLALSSMVCVPLVMIIRLCQTEGSFLVVSTWGPRLDWGAGKPKATLLAVCCVTLGMSFALSPAPPPAPWSRLDCGQESASWETGMKYSSHGRRLCGDVQRGL